VVRADKFIACGGLLIDNVLVYQTVSRESVQTSVDGSLTDIDTLCPEVIGYLLARKMRTCIILKEIKDLTGLLGIIRAALCSGHLKASNLI
jgi:hypothetical protein